LEPGTEVREYRIERMLGQGGMGEVYLAEQTTTGRKVAMKVVAPQLMLDEAVKRRFIEEARVMAALDHTNIVSLYTFFEEGGRFFLVMKYIDGESVDERVEREGPSPVDEAVRISEGVLSALEYAHTRPQPVIHRDIKPANILLGKDGSVVVMDFGIAKAVGREKLTRTAGIVGTFEYMSPEQIMGSEVSPATDIYCFGITLYKMLTGVVPFPQKTETGIDCMDSHRHKAPPTLSEYRDQVPGGIEQAVLRSLEKEPAARFASAAALSEALESVPEPPPASGPAARAMHVPPERPEPPTGPPLLVKEDSAPPGLSITTLVMIGAGVAALILVAVLVFGVGGKKSDGSKRAGNEKAPSWQSVSESEETGEEGTEATEATEADLPRSPESWARRILERPDAEFGAAYRTELELRRERYVEFIKARAHDRLGESRSVRKTLLIELFHASAIEMSFLQLEGRVDRALEMWTVKYLIAVHSDYEQWRMELVGGVLDACRTVDESRTAPASATKDNGALKLYLALLDRSNDASGAIRSPCFTEGWHGRVGGPQADDPNENTRLLLRPAMRRGNLHFCDLVGRLVDESVEVVGSHFVQALRNDKSRLRAVLSNSSSPHFPEEIVKAFDDDLQDSLGDVQFDDSFREPIAPGWKGLIDRSRIVEERVRQMSTEAGGGGCRIAVARAISDWTDLLGSSVNEE